VIAYSFIFRAIILFKLFINFQKSVTERWINNMMDLLYFTRFCYKCYKSRMRFFFWSIKFNGVHYFFYGCLTMIRGLLSSARHLSYARAHVTLNFVLLMANGWPFWRSTFACSSVQPSYETGQWWIPWKINKNQKRLYLVSADNMLYCTFWRWVNA